jgi:sn-glycerol 3-phosphate transport system permease protein
VYDSLFDTRMASDNAPFVGLDNFVRLFADNVFWQSLLNNLLYILLTVVPGVTLALLLAVALSENHRVNRWLRTAFFFPMIIPMVSAAALWLFIFMPGLGLLDHYLAKLFGPMNNNWLGAATAPAGAGADRRMEVRRLLHAVFPRRVAEHPGLNA